MCCLADTNINARSALQQHVLISDNSRVRKSYFLITHKTIVLNSTLYIAV